ncbi:MAG: hypothetical protein RR639_00580 [Hydrogenoanaerobacterium sp.]
MNKDISAYLNYIIITMALLALIFVILWFVGRKKNIEFKENGGTIPADYTLGERDIVLLRDGRRVAISEALDDSTAFAAKTLPDYGRTAENITIKKADIVKIEYYGSIQKTAKEK